MSLIVRDNGVNNTVIIDDETREAVHGSVTIEGDGNTIIVGRGSSAYSANIHVRNGNTVHIGEGVRLAAAEIYADHGATIRIGSYTSFTSNSKLFCHEPKQISIGERCLIAPDTMFTVSDIHSIYNLETGERTNPPADVIVEDEVWVGVSVYVLKGAVVRRGSVVGARAIVTGEIPPNCLAVGSPAKPIKLGVCWRPDLPRETDESTADSSGESNGPH